LDAHDVINTMEAEDVVRFFGAARRQPPPLPTPTTL
jgi:hypothetical protein